MTNNVKQEEFFFKAGFHKHKQSYRGKGLYYSVGGYDITKSDAEQIMKAVNQQVIQALERAKGEAKDIGFGNGEMVSVWQLDNLIKEYKGE